MTEQQQDALRTSGGETCEPIKHNHLTRDIKDRGICPACDWYWEENERRHDDD